ncbi:MAG: peptidoglycan-binding protein [Lachnospiraceae bacterium]|nr:peptidoglycan-binding protein [Lachnospiraceae bacterium]MDY5541450.1 peptidoglycan-binding protein [Lachnospiraceae bacterium]
MAFQNLKILQEEAVDTGLLKIDAVAEDTNVPIPEATVSISYSGDPTSTIEQLTTDNNGQTEALTLPAPPLEYSMEAERPQPYSEYTITISAPGYDDLQASGVEVLPLVTALYHARLKPRTAPATESFFVIGPHTLYGDYPPKIAESEIKPLAETGEIVLSRVVVPETVIVHDGPPTDRSARNYYVPYKDYIKNVASSEIYATWPDASIRANVLAIMSFTLNRVFTEWYRNKGYDFTITSSTAFDHKWIPGRNYFDTISLIVDELFANYLSRPNVRQPILTQYCDGQRVVCPDWMSQWGSRSLGDQGFSAIDILRYYYGDNMYINTAEQISGIPSSWPGYDLTVGASGQKVLQMQEELNTISDAYSSIPKLSEDGIFGPATAAAVRQFQSVFGLPATGIVDYPTWYKISEIYVGVSRIAELV